MRNLKWWHWALIALAAATVINGIFNPESQRRTNETSRPVDPDAAFERISDNSYFAMTFDPRSDPDEVLRVAREHCNEFEFCRVYGWTDPDFVAGALPLTDREEEHLDFTYNLVRWNGVDRAWFNCRRWDLPNERCLNGTHRAIRGMNDN